jgi:two-component system response regulator QseB
MRLLLIEDDSMIGESIRHGLGQDGFVVDWVQDGRAASLALQQGSYAAVLLDLGLPGKSGLELLRELRKGGNPLPVLVITARDAVTDRVQGLDAGADDYLVKPFDLSELAARVRAVLRRHAGRADSLVTHGDLVLDPVGHEASYRGKCLNLSAREFALLLALLEKPGAVLSRKQLEERLYGWEDELGSNAVEVHIHKLRKKLGAGVILNIRGVGYRVAENP